MSKMSYETSENYLGRSKFNCDCLENADMWISGTSANPGRIFLKCAMHKVKKYKSQHTCLRSFDSFFLCSAFSNFQISCLDSIQRCNFFAWEDEVSERNKGGKKQATGVGDTHRPSKKPNGHDQLDEIRLELVSIRYILTVILVCCLWVAARLWSV